MPGAAPPIPGSVRSCSSGSEGSRGFGAHHTFVIIRNAQHTLGLFAQMLGLRMLGFVSFGAFILSGYSRLCEVAARWQHRLLSVDCPTSHMSSRKLDLNQYPFQFWDTSKGSDEGARARATSIHTMQQLIKKIHIWRACSHRLH